MSCNPTRLELSNTAATSVQVTISPDPGNGTTVYLEVPGLSITASAVTSGAVASYVVGALTQDTNSLWDGTIQVGTNAPADIVVQVVETASAQIVGVTVSDADVSYCAPSGGGGEASSLNGPVLFDAKNTSGGTMTKGQVVYISGHSGTETQVGLADCDVAGQMPAFGLVNTASAPNNAAVEIVTFGEITGIDTSSFNVGDVLYVSATAGVLQNTPPAGESALLQNMGKVIRSHATEGIVKVIGAGRTNATPNLNQDRIFLGNASNQAVATSLSAVGLTKFDQDLSDSYLMLVESPTAGKTYTVDGRAATARTITNLYGRTSAGSCSVSLKNLTDATTIGTLAVSTSGGSAGSLTNTAVDENDRLGLEITLASTPADLEIVVEYTG